MAEKNIRFQFDTSDYFTCVDSEHYTMFNFDRGRDRNENKLIMNRVKAAGDGSRTLHPISLALNVSMLRFIICLTMYQFANCGTPEKK